MDEQWIIRLCYMQLLDICDNYDNHDGVHDSDEKYNNSVYRTVSPNTHIVKSRDNEVYQPHTIMPCLRIERNALHIYLPRMLLNQ